MPSRLAILRVGVAVTVFRPSRTVPSMRSRAGATSSSKATIADTG